MICGRRAARRGTEPKTRTPSASVDRARDPCASGRRSDLETAISQQVVLTPRRASARRVDAAEASGKSRTIASATVNIPAAFRGTPRSAVKSARREPHGQRGSRASGALRTRMSMPAMSLHPGAGRTRAAHGPTAVERVPNADGSRPFSAPFRSRNVSSPDCMPASRRKKPDVIQRKRALWRGAGLSGARCRRARDHRLV